MMLPISHIGVFAQHRAQVGILEIELRLTTMILLVQRCLSDNSSVFISIKRVESMVKGA